MCKIYNYKIQTAIFLFFLMFVLNIKVECITLNKPNDTGSSIAVISLDSDESLGIHEISTILRNAAKDNETKSKINLAQTYYEMSCKAFRAKNFKKAKKNFNLFLDALKDANINPLLYFFIFDNLDEVLKNLNSIYSSITSTSTSIVQEYSIDMSIGNNSLVRKYIAKYSSYKISKGIIELSFERMGTYRDMVLKTLREMNISEELLYLPIVESFYNINTISRSGAVGLWQIMAHRGRALGLHINYWIDERKDPEKSTKAACLYLKQLYIMLNDWHLVLAAYNRGEYGLIRDMRFSNASNISEMISRNAIPKETQEYVPKFIAVATIAKNLKTYGFENIKYMEPVKYDVYYTDKVMDLKVVAKCANTTLEEIKKLNPALQAWSTPHNYPKFALKIPYGSKNTFLENISKVKDLNPSPGFIKHKVVKGEYLEKIASKYKTTLKEIDNNNPVLLKQKYLNIGQVLVIRPGRKYFT